MPPGSHATIGLSNRGDKLHGGAYRKKPEWESGRKILSDGSGDLVEPSDTLVRRAEDHDTECSPVKPGYAAEIEDAVFPDPLEGIAKNGLLPLRRRIGCIEDQRGTGLQKTSGNPFAAITLQKFIGNSRPQYPIHPSF